MPAVTSGTTKLSRWVTLAIILAVALLSGCLLLSLIVGDTFQQEVSRVTQNLPADSFIISVKHHDVASLASEIKQLPQQAPGIGAVARATPPVATPKVTMHKEGNVTVILESVRYIGVDPEYFSVRHLPLAQGRLFDAADRGNVAVIGADLAAMKGYQIGSTISNECLAQRYEVIGILQPTDAKIDTHPTSYPVNEMMFVPIGNLPKLVVPTGHMLRFDHNHIDEIEENLRTWVSVWVELDKNAALTMEAVGAGIKDSLSAEVYGPRKTPSGMATHEYVAERTSSSLEQMGFIVIAVGALSISGLMLMHVLLGAKVIGIKRALGATKDRLVWENLWRYSLLSLSGFLLSLILIQPLLPMVGNFLEVELQVSPRTLLYAMLGITALTPLCGLIPTVEASKVSPLDAIYDRLGWGLGKRRIDLRQIIVSLAFAAAVGTMLLVSQIGFATLAGIDANLRAIGSDMLLMEEPPAGSVSPMPTLSEADDAHLVDKELLMHGETAWMANARLPIGISADSLSRANVLAVKRNVLKVRNYTLADGEWLSSDRELVIGSELARNLFGKQSPLGKTILLGNDSNPFTVVGVLEPRPRQLADFDFDRDKAVFIGWSDHKLAAPTALFQTRIFFRAGAPTAVEPAKETIQRLLTESNPHAEQLVVRNPLGDLEATRHLTKTFSLSASIMALVAVITACASVAALTLIQAKELQKMLALRRACGATRREVLVIILREVLTLIIIGAAIGLSLAQIGFQWWAKNNGLPSASNWGLALVGLVCSFAIAVLSAVWPAWHVARQAPAELLD